MALVKQLIWSMKALDFMSLPMMAVWVRVWAAGVGGW